MKINLEPFPRNFVGERNEYEPYGQVLKPATLKDGPGYTGHVLDANTGLNYAQQRYYDPGIGRFLSVDPVTSDGNSGANFNRYKYASNSPYRFTDPDGRMDKDEVKRRNDEAERKRSRKPIDRLIEKGKEIIEGVKRDVDEFAKGSVAGELPIVATASLAITLSPIGPEVRPLTAEARVVAETLSNSGPITSNIVLTADEALSAAVQFLGQGYREIGKAGSGVFRSADDLRQFRMDRNSLAGAHSPGVPHVHFEIYAPGAAKPTVNNHVPFVD